MGAISRVLATAALATASVTIGLIQPASAQQGYGSLPGYSAHPAGMCWYQEFGSGMIDQSVGGYWAACKNTASNQTLNGARQNPSERNSLNSFARAR
jgi:hypothetical protein